MQNDKNMPKFLRSAVKKVIGDHRKYQFCPECDTEISSQDINIEQGMALCPECGTLSQLSDLNYSSFLNETVLNESRKDIKITSKDNEVTIKVSLFSFPEFAGSMFFALFWNGIVSVFVSLAAAAVYYQMFGPVPEWFPTPGLKNGQPIMNDKVMGVGETAFLCLFLTPFVIIGTGVAFNALLRLCGSTTITLNNYESIVSTGALFLGGLKNLTHKKYRKLKQYQENFSRKGAIPN